jgi:hypothetical protein
MRSQRRRPNRESGRDRLTDASAVGRRTSSAAGAAGAEFERRHRPRTVELAFSDGTTLTRNLADRPRFQHLDFPPRSVARVTITIADVFQAPRTAENYNRTSLSEVRFYRPA